jgi:hypothetical protein
VVLLADSFQLLGQEQLYSMQPAQLADAVGIQGFSPVLSRSTLCDRVCVQSRERAERELCFSSRQSAIHGALQRQLRRHGDKLCQAVVKVQIQPPAVGNG